MKGSVPSSSTLHQIQVVPHVLPFDQSEKNAFPSPRDGKGDRFRIVDHTRAIIRQCGVIRENVMRDKFCMVNCSRG